MGRFTGPQLSLIVATLSAATPALAYTPTITPSGAAVRLHGALKLNLAGNPTNQSGLDAPSFFNAVVHGLQRWQAASSGALKFDYWQGTDPVTYEPDSDYNGISSVYFASNTKGGRSALPSNVLGLTQVWYNTDTGEILETDVALNDINYHFTTDPKDTSGYGNSIGGGDSKSVFIENVLTHEIGHAFGLSHSGGLQSTMLFMESPEQAFLGCDEQAGIQAVYNGPASNNRGSISGNVVSERGGAPVFGAQVVAISRRRGTVIATALTDKNGGYLIGSIEPGEYYLMAEPFYAGASALPSYYSSMSTGVCGGSSFGRTVLTAGDGNTPQSIVVRSGANTTAPQFAPHCGSTSGGSSAAIASMPAAGALVSAPPIIDGSSRSSGGFGVAARLDGTSSSYYRLQAISGSVELHAMAYSLYSPIHPSISLLDSSGNAVPAQKQENVYTGVSGYVNHDSSLVATDLPKGDYLVQVSSTRLNASVYPAGPVSLDSVPFLVITGSLNDPSTPPPGALPEGARCKMDENFAAYASPPGLPPRQKQEDSNGGGGGFCGSMSLSSGGGSSNGPGAGPGGTGAIAGWFLPFFMMGAIARLSRRLHLRQTPNHR